MDMLKAGSLPYRRCADGTVEILTIAAPGSEHWTLPMGRLEPGEGYEGAAARETSEEAGVQVAIGPYLGTLSWERPQGMHHEVRFYLGEYVAETDWPESDRRQRRWIPLASATAALAPDFQPFAATAAQLLGNRFA